MLTYAQRPSKALRNADLGESAVPRTEPEQPQNAPAEGFGHRFENIAVDRVRSGEGETAAPAEPRIDEARESTGSEGRISRQPNRLNAAALTQNTEIHLGPGQERHLPHEAWHAVQQSVRKRVQMMKRMMARIGGKR